MTVSLIDRRLPGTEQPFPSAAMHHDRPALTDRLPYHPDPIEEALLERFERVVNHFPDRSAVRSGATSVSYVELAEKSDSIASQLLQSEHDSSRPVALLFRPGIEAIAALLGVLKTGSFYAPLDPTHPEDRLRILLKEIGPCSIMASPEFAGLARAIAHPDQQVLIPRADSSLPPPSGPMISPGKLAYLMFTSGSTGIPKGVLQTRQNVLADIQRQSVDLAVAPDDRCGLVYPISSSASICHIFGALLNGACVCVLNLRESGHRQIAEWIVEERITILDINVSLFRYVAPEMERIERPDSLRILSPGSEPVLRRDFDLYRRHFNDACLLQNALGTTETRTATQCFLTKDSAFEGDQVPVGFDVEGKQVLLLDENRQPVRDGDTGEIVIQSPFISPGYWRRPDLTERAFLPPSNGRDAPRYLTGDLGRRNSDGALVHLGRRDFQVRVRGFRVEMGEIENRLAAHPAVMDAAVAAHADQLGNNRLAAYLVVDPDHVPVIRELRDFLGKTLPREMIPHAFQFLERLPSTPSGKLDRSALLPPAIPTRTRSSCDRPLTPTESRLADLWREVLGIGDLGPEDDFFELGGDSLLAAALFTRIETTFGMSLPLSLLHESASLESLAGQIARHSAPDASTRRSGFKKVVKFNAEGSLPPLIAIPGAAASAMSFRHLASLLGPEQPLIVPEHRGIDQRELPCATIPAMAASMLERLDAEAFRPPYRICGYSVGGLVAYELARLLLDRGDAVSWFGILDTVEPGHDETRVLRNPRPRNRLGIPALVRLAREGREIMEHSQDLAYLRVQQMAGRTARSGEWKRRMDAIHIRAAAAYRPKPLDLGITLFSAMRRGKRKSELPEDLGWSPLALQGLKIMSLDMNHQILREPHVRQLAPVLKQAIESDFARCRPS